MPPKINYLTITADVTSENLILRVMGELDLETAPQLGEVIMTAMMASIHEKVIVDLRQTTIIDSQGLAVLLRARNAGQPRTRLVVLARPGGVVDRVLKASSLNTYLNLTYSLDTEDSLS
jgi:anti-anti-sigma factor